MRVEDLGWRISGGGFRVWGELRIYLVGVGHGFFIHHGTVLHTSPTVVTLYL